MTLTEYLAQTDPVRMPEVILQTGEYEVFSSAGIAPNRFTHVYVPAVQGSYTVKEGETNLYTQNEFGYPKNRSCFHLPEPITLLVHARAN